MKLLEALDAVDRRLLAALRVPQTIMWIRRQPLATLGILVVLLYGPIVARIFAGGELLGAIWMVSYVAGLVGLVLTAMAAVADMNDRGLRGGIWGLLILVTNVVGLVAWIVVRQDVERVRRQ